VAGIYLHIPFCKQACHYCDFHFSTSLNTKDALLDALAIEIQIQQNYLRKAPLETVYFGGGTPSLLSGAEITGIIAELEKYHTIVPHAEVTLEANPDDLTTVKLEELKNSPVNRLSIGIQSFVARDLTFMNRAHNVDEAITCVKKAQSAGFDNCSIDLIYGVPGLTETEWLANLEQAVQLGVQHISAYCLTVEPKTALAKFVETGKVQPVSDDVAAQQFEQLVKTLTDAGFIHYEISNFCLPGYHSKHNSNYWKREKYLGLGPSAHSFNGASRQWNVANNVKYIKALEAEKLDFESEHLSLTTQYNEYLLTTLRTMWGVELKIIELDFGPAYLEYCLKEAGPHIREGNLHHLENKLTLSQQGKLLADKIAADLFYIEA